MTFRDTGPIWSSEETGLPKTLAAPLMPLRSPVDVGEELVDAGLRSLRLVLHQASMRALDRSGDFRRETNLRGEVDHVGQRCDPSAIRQARAVKRRRPSLLHNGQAAATLDNRVWL